MASDKLDDPRKKSMSFSKSRSSMMNPIEGTGDVYLNTLYFLALFVRMETTNTALQTTLSKFEKHCQTSKSADIQEVFAMLAQRINPGGAASPTIPSITLDQDMSVNDRIIINMVYMSTNLGQDFDKSFPSGCSFIPSFLRITISEGRHIQLITKTLAGLLKLGPKLISGNRLLLILHLIRTFVISCPTFVKPSLEPIITSLMPFSSMLPDPYCVAVRRVISLLQDELWNPGNLLRSSVMNNMFGRDIPEASDASVCPNHFALFPSASQFNNPFMDTHEAYPSVSKLKLMVLLDWMKTSRAVEQLDYEKLPGSAVDEAFDEYLKFLSSARRLSEEDATILRGVSTDAAWESLKVAPPRTQRVSRQVQHGSVLINGQFGRIALEGANEDVLGLGMHKLGMLPVRCFFFETDEQSLFPTNTLTDRKLLQSRSALQLKAILYQIKESRIPQGRICIRGDVQGLHSVVCAYVSLRETEPELFTGLNLHFLIIPVPLPSPSPLAQFLAYKDVVYNSTIFTPFRNTRSFVPSRSLAKDEPAPLKSLPEIDQGILASQTIPSPQLLFHHELQFYLWNAKNVFPVYLFQCQAYHDTTNNADCITIPFCQMVEIGSRASEAAVPPAKGESLDKSFELTIRFSQMNPQFHVNRVRTELFSTLSTLQISNVPHDETSSADPTTPFLELYGEEPKQKTRQKLKPKGSDAVRAFDGPLRYYVSECEVKAVHKTMDKFHILVDGTVFGPYWRIVITPLTFGDNTQHAVMPFVTYLPANT
eukprot:c9161_g1_i1.p1 GENE.c9161_g1_i1~~c9161_g1_i1.p1  ORF type:complete len:830 (+),score=127.97 c9161_g1_i1:197-2491(+)